MSYNPMDPVHANPKTEGIRKKLADFETILQKLSDEFEIHIGPQEFFALEYMRQMENQKTFGELIEGALEEAVKDRNIAKGDFE